jgi:hypothetical protein
MGCATQAAASLFEIAPLVALENRTALALPDLQLRSLVPLLLKLYSLGYAIALVFFAVFGMFIGVLIYRSTFLPRFIGVLFIVAGLAWLSFLSPQFGSRNLRYIMPFAAGEAVLTLWLLIVGVNVERWWARAAGPDHAMKRE